MVLQIPRRVVRDSSSLGRSAKKTGPASSLHPRKVLVHEQWMTVCVRDPQFSPVEILRRASMATPWALNLDSIIGIEEDDIAATKCPKRLSEIVVALIILSVSRLLK